jgi:hypothetical protein
MKSLEPGITGRTSGTVAAGDVGSGPQLDPIEARRVVDLKEASRLSGISIDGLKRHYSKLILTLSPRRRGMRLRNVLSIGSSENSTV